jgi:hypothetical protein
MVGLNKTLRLHLGMLKAKISSCYMLVSRQLLKSIINQINHTCVGSNRFANVVGGMPAVMLIIQVCGLTIISELMCINYDNS